MSELAPRQQTILRAIIVEYVNAAEPVGSEMLVQKYQLGVKAATVRNEMAEMLELGYLEQPHTSAGRIPSDLGYRHYVDRLIVSHELEESAQARVSEAADEGDALQGVLRDTVRALSRVTHLLSLATTVRDGSVSVRHALVSAMGSNQVLMVLVLSNGHVENRMIECPPGLTLDELGQTNELLTTMVAGKTLQALAKFKSPPAGTSPGEKLLNLIGTTVRSIAKDLTRGMMIIEGEEFLFAQPEFQRDLSALTDLLGKLTESDFLYESVASGDETRTVTIGRENRHEQMKQLSVIRHSFFVGDNEAGIIALVGPTRMRYEQGIPLVNYTARALSESLTRSFG